MFTNENLTNAVERLKSYHPDDWAAHGIINKAKTGYICPNPNCRNGSGRDGTGATAKAGNKGWQVLCPVCQDGYDIIDTLGFFFNLSPQTQFADIVKRGCQMFGVDIETGDADYAPDYKPDEKKIDYERIKRTILNAQKNLGKFFAKYGNPYRGIYYATFEDFGCGYDPQWYARKDAPRTPRLIIPSSWKHYAARLIGKLEDFHIPDGVNLGEKEHSWSPKPIFNFNRLKASDDPICFIVEGELDAMSIAQVTARPAKSDKNAYPINVIAIAGIKLSSLMEEQLKSLPQKNFIVMLDNDAAGNKAAPILVAKLKSLGHKACNFTLSHSYNDANDFLRADHRGLKQRIKDIYSNAKELFANYPDESIPTVEDNDFSEAPAQVDDDMEQYLYGLKDLGNAQRMEKFCGKHIRWLYDSERWLIWRKQGVWFKSTDSNSALTPFFTCFANKLLKYKRKLDKELKNLAAKFTTKTPDGQITRVDEKIKQDYDNCRLRTEIVDGIVEDFHSSGKIAAATTLLKGIESIIIWEKDLDTHPNLLNCLNGVVDLQTGKLYPANPSLLITQQVNAYYRPNYRNPDVDKFLHDILPDDDTLAAWLRWLGYCLTGSVAEEKAFLMFGPGGNGKGTLTKVLMTLYNNYACSLPVSAVCENPRLQDAGAATTELNVLEKKRLAIVEELPQGRKLDAAKFKRITGGDKIPIRRLYEEFTDIEPTHKIIISGNYRPELTDAHDDGLIRRIKNVDFKQSFTGERRDPHLKEKLLNPDALSGLLSLLVDEAVAWYKDGLIFSPAMEQSTKSYFNQFDFLGEFISEFCEYGSGKFIKLKSFMARLREEYPDETAIISDRNLKDMIKRLAGKDGVEYQSRHGKDRGAAIVGIGFIDDDWSGERINPNTTAIPK